MNSLSIDRPKRSQVQLAVKDIVDGIMLWQLWGRLGWNDIAQRYRRSLLGPLWLTASMGVMVIALGVIYSRIFKMTLTDFIPFLTVGLIVWSFVSTLLIEGCSLFIGSESHIKQIRLPYSVYVYRFMWGKVIVLAHNFVIYVGVLIYFKIWPGSAGVWAIPGFLLLAFNGALTAVYLGMVSARFRDIPQIVASVTQIIFFITPIMWKPELLGSHSILMELNPFYHLTEIVRAPLLGGYAPFESYSAAIFITAVNCAFAFLFFVRFRARISYWV
jgi:ABC-2 type transport system permease protein/lipopolysaccharide transport system permease protein